MAVPGENLQFEFCTPLNAANVIFIETAIAEVLEIYGWGGKKSLKAAAEISSFYKETLIADPAYAGSEFVCTMSLIDRTCRLEFRVGEPLDCVLLSRTIADSKHWSSIVTSSELDLGQRKLSVQLALP